MRVASVSVPLRDAAGAAQLAPFKFAFADSQQLPLVQGNKRIVPCPRHVNFNTLHRRVRQRCSIGRHGVGEAGGNVASMRAHHRRRLRAPARTPAAKQAGDTAVRGACISACISACACVAGARRAGVATHREMESSAATTHATPTAASCSCLRRASCARWLRYLP